MEYPSGEQSHKIIDYKIKCFHNLYIRLIVNLSRLEIEFMFSKTNIIKNGVPTLVAFLFLWFVGDWFVLLSVFKATDNGNLNLAIWIVVDAIMLFSVFYGTRWVLFKMGLIERWQGKMGDKTDDR